jgi:hypothetical protein
MNNMTKTVTLTLEQARLALQCVEASIAASEDSYFSDMLEVSFTLRRAELAQRLNTAINNAMKETK